MPLVGPIGQCLPFDVITKTLMDSVRSLTPGQQATYWRFQHWTKQQARLDSLAAISEEKSAKDSRWRSIGYRDEFGDYSGEGAISPTVNPVYIMSSPYGDVQATIYVDCNRAWVRFDDSPNLTDGVTSSGYNSYWVNARVYYRSAGEWRVTQNWGSDDVVFEDASRAIGTFAAGETVSISFPWYGEGKVAFTWPLNGSSEMIRSSCD